MGKERTLSITFVDKHADKNFNWSYISRNYNWPIWFIHKHRSKVVMCENIEKIIHRAANEKEILRKLDMIVEKEPLLLAQTNPEPSAPIEVEGESTV